MASRDAQRYRSRGRSSGQAHRNRIEPAYDGTRGSGYPDTGGGSDDDGYGGRLLGGPGGGPGVPGGWPGDRGGSPPPPRRTTGFPGGPGGGGPGGGGYGGGGYGGGPGGPGGYGGGPGGPTGGGRGSARPGRGRKRFIDYPRFGRTGWKRWIPSWRLISGLFLLGLGGVAVSAMMVYASVSVPEPDKSANDQTTYVYYDDGKTLIGSWSTVNRNIVKLDTVPKPVQDAVLSAEDRTFYTNKGVSVTGLLRAAWSNSSGGSVQGGSTITQQYVKVVLLKDSSRTISRKVKEFVIALKISREKSKEQILEDYLNSIYFGRGASGIDAAARAYFGHGVAQLTPPEGAFLAGIINGPNLYEPTDPEGLARAKDRWTYVADGMVTMGEITAQQRAQMVFPKAFVAQRQQIVGNGIEPQNRYLMQMVAAEMATHGITDEQLKTMGYRIVTTFNKKMVDEAVQAVQDKLGPRNATGKKKGWPVGTQAALVSIDPATGAVKAIYGGDGTTRFRNAATDDTAQAGSTFKPFALIAGLEGDPDGKYSHLQADGSKITDLNGGQDPLSLHSRFDGRSPQKFVGLDKPVKNAEGSYGMIDLVTATEHSVNTAYMNLNELVDPLHTQNVATRAGVPAADVKHTGVNNVLGVDDPHPIDMASAYATIAAQGVYHKPHVIAQIRTSAGGVICCQATPGETRFDKNVVADATFALQQVVKGGTGSYAGANLNRPIAGKTGTTDANVSAWFVGFTPQLSTAVSMYRIDTKAPFGPLPLKGFQGFSDSGMVGGSLPIRVWTDYMSLALKGQPVANLPTPVYGGQDQNPTPTTSTPTVTPSSPSQPTGHPTWTPPTDTGTPTDTPTGGPTSTASVTLPTLTRGGKPTTSP